MPYTYRHCIDPDQTMAQLGRGRWVNKLRSSDAVGATGTRCGVSFGVQHPGRSGGPVSSPSSRSLYRSVPDRCLGSGNRRHNPGPSLHTSLRAVRTCRDRGNARRDRGAPRRRDALRHPHRHGQSARLRHRPGIPRLYRSGRRIAGPRRSAFTASPVVPCAVGAGRRGTRRCEWFLSQQSGPGA